LLTDPSVGKEAEMLWRLSDLKLFSIRAQDGPIGRVSELLVSDETWTVRYLVVDTAEGVLAERVLLSPLAFDTPNGPAKVLPVRLTKNQVRNAPAASREEPVSRHRERELHDYYGWPYYWIGGPIWGPFLTPGELSRAQFERAPLPEAEEAKLRKTEPPSDPHLRSTNEVEGYRFEAVDGELGHVQDFVLDDGDWRIKYFEITTRTWWPGKKVLLPAEHVREVRWDDRRVHADVRRETVKKAPRYEESEPISPQLEKELAQHYGLELSVGGFR
jgi:hypothetical protein